MVQMLNVLLVLKDIKSKIMLVNNVQIFVKIAMLHLNVHLVYLDIIKILEMELANNVLLHVVFVVH